MDKITFKAVEKYRYGLWKTLSKHLKQAVYIPEHNLKFIKEWSEQVDNRNGLLEPLRGESGWNFELNYELGHFFVVFVFRQKNYSTLKY